MTEQEHWTGRGSFSCRIDGRAGYLSLWDDRIELVRSGRRGPQVLQEVIPMDQVAGVSTGKAGRLFTMVELAAAGRVVQLKLPAVDAPLVVELIEGLAHAARPPAQVTPTIWSVGPEPTMPDPVLPQFVMPAPLLPEFVMPDPVMPHPVMPDPVMPDLVMPEPVLSEPATPEPGLPDPVIPEPVPEPVLPQPGSPEPVMPEPGAPEPVLPQPGTPQPLLPDFEVPDFTGLTVEMPEWTPLPESELPEPVLSQSVIDEPRPKSAPVPQPAAVVPPVAEVAPVSAVEPQPDPSVSAAAAALAELDNMLGEIPTAREGDAELPGDEVAAHAPAEVEAAEVEASEVDADSTPGPGHPAGLSPHLVKRLNRLEVLRSSGVMTEKDYAEAEAGILETAWDEARSA